MLWTDDGSHCGKDSGRAAARKQEERLQLSTHSLPGRRRGEGEGLRGEGKGRGLATVHPGILVRSPCLRPHTTVLLSAHVYRVQFSYHGYRISSVITCRFVGKSAGLRRPIKIEIDRIMDG